MNAYEYVKKEINRKHRGEWEVGHEVQIEIENIPYKINTIRKAINRNGFQSLLDEDCNMFAVCKYL